MREAMLTQVPEEFRARFRGAIRNDPTLQDRLLALAARLCLASADSAARGLASGLRPTTC